MARRTTSKKKRSSLRNLFSQGRVKRGPAPMVQLKQKSYRKALPELRRDFEDPQTHELVGKSPAAIYHIDVIDLNDPGLIEERKTRAELLGKLFYLKERAVQNPEMLNVVNKVLEMSKNLIPDIPAPPGYWTILDHPVSV